MFQRRKVLGLAVTPDAITAVEVVPVNGGGRLARSAVFRPPDAVGLDQTVDLGKALKQFLHDNGFSASRCVIGIDASRLTAREKTLPPKGRSSAVEILSLMVEREFASGRNDLVFDFSLAAGETPSALLVAAPRQVLDQLNAMAAAAGLSVLAITSSMTALAAVTDCPADREQLVLHLSAHGAELALQTGGGIAMVRRLGPATGAGAGTLVDLVGQLRRVVALLTGGGANRELVVWDELGLGSADVERLSAMLELPVSTFQMPEGLAPSPETRSAEAGQHAPAAAMALEAARGNAPIIDLLHSRLTPRKRLGMGRRSAWAAAVAAALIVAAAAYGVDWRRDYVEAASLKQRAENMKADVNEARDVNDKVTFAGPWYDGRPSYLDCIREVTRAFPDEGTIWTTSMAIQEDMKVVLSGKAVSESVVLDVLDRLKKNSRLSYVQSLYLRQAGRSGREIAFALSFQYVRNE